MVVVESLWKTSAPLMRPRSNEGKGPSAVNVNFFGDSHSQVRWHSDDEPSFGLSGEPKLIVSLSLGAGALFRWKSRRFCSLCVEDGTLHSHGDLLVMDGLAQDEFLHQTDPGLESQRINLTFRWILKTCPRLSTINRISMYFTTLCA